MTSLDEVNCYYLYRVKSYLKGTNLKLFTLLVTFQFIVKKIQKAKKPRRCFCRGVGISFVKDSFILWLKISYIMYMQVMGYFFGKTTLFLRDQLPSSLRCPICHRQTGLKKPTFQERILTSIIRSQNRGLNQGLKSTQPSSSTNGNIKFGGRTLSIRIKTLI